MEYEKNGIKFAAIGKNTGLQTCFESINYN